MTLSSLCPRPLLRLALLLPLLCGLATPSFAQHVVTDSEAGKLTFDALTATPAPVFRRVVYRPQTRRMVYARGGWRSVHQAAWSRPVARAAVWRQVAWHPAAHRPAAHVAGRGYRHIRRG